MALSTCSSREERQLSLYVEWGETHLISAVKDVPLVITVHHSLYVDVSDTKQLLRVKILSRQNAKYARYSILSLTSSVFLNLNKKLGGLVSETTL